MRGLRTTVLIFRILAASWVAFVTVFAGLQSLGYIPATPRLEPIAWTISLSIIGVESVGSIVRDRIQSGRTQIKKDLDRWSLLFVLEHLKGHGQGLEFEDLGVSVWVPTFRSRFLRASREKTKLKRWNRFRPDDYPQPSGIDWTGSVGTLGECWRTKRNVYWEGNALANRWAGVELTPTAFKRIRETSRKGFSQEQFAQIVGKYSEVLAVPMWHDDATKGTMIGVLTIDRIYVAGQTNFTPKLDGESTLRLAAATASAASSTLTGKSS